ncbi:LLM class flavin-dependent oxidoreductase [Gordonia jinhuaensis]|uniref:Oxidoreductase n=1 Tax=Gordonia jinhuaensis TaxID=1517702 RepID=A0A916T1G5_9ACTN|nr:oxidoreductase [Gordonia jinhuaensis]
MPTDSGASNPSDTPDTGARPGSDTIDFGLHTFGDITRDADGHPLPAAQVLRNVVAEAQAADAAGVGFFGVEEHHRADFAISAPEVVLGAIASVTDNIRLGSAVTVLSSDDPVRVYERFSTLDGLSGGRAEIIVGRGSFIESFPLFGYELENYEILFDEKLELFERLLHNEPVSWSGTQRAPLTDQRVYPAPESGRRIRTWVGVGGSPESVVRAARFDLPMMLAIIGGSPARFAPLADLYRRAYAQFGTPLQPLAVHSPGFVADTDEEAKNIFYPFWQAQMTQLGRERGWGPVTRAEFEHAVGPDGALFVGSPQTVAAKITSVVQLLDLDRFDLKYSMGNLGHEHLLHCVQLFGTEVIPLVRQSLSVTSE